MFNFSLSPKKYVIMITIPILVTLIAFTSGKIAKINVKEGEDVELDFSYPCDSSEVTLQHSYRAPFYYSTHPESMLLPANQKLSVHEERGECSIRLLFTPALRSNGGAYILSTYSASHILLKAPMTELRVDYPPGMAICEWSGEQFVDDWVSVKCTAPAGSLTGEIVCYQNGHRVPYLKAPAEVDGTLEQTLWVKYAEPAFCCAVAIGLTVDRCDCKDIVWDPYKNVGDPCPLTTPQAQQHDSTSSQSYPPIPTIMLVDTKKPNSNVTLHASYFFPIIGVSVPTVIICLIVALVLSRRRSRASRRTRLAATRSSGVPDEGYTTLHYIGQAVSRRIPWSAGSVERSSEP